MHRRHLADTLGAAGCALAQTAPTRLPEGATPLAAEDLGQAIKAVCKEIRSKEGTLSLKRDSGDVVKSGPR